MRKTPKIFDVEKGTSQIFGGISKQFTVYYPSFISTPAKTKFTEHSICFDFVLFTFTSILPY